MKKHYINAVVSLLHKGNDIDVVLANLVTTLQKKGHEKLHSEILKGVIQKLSFEKSSNARVVVASAHDAEKQQQSIATALQALGGNAQDATVTVDPTLIGGFIASHKGRLINHSYKEKLVSLYRSITK